MKDVAMNINIYMIREEASYTKHSKIHVTLTITATKIISTSIRPPWL